MRTLCSLSHALRRAYAATPFGQEQRCAACGRVCAHSGGEQLVCPDCARMLQHRSGGFCPACGELFADSTLPKSLCGACLKNPPPWQQLTFFGEYSDLLRTLILRCKFSQDSAAARLLGRLLGRILLTRHEMTPQQRAVTRIIPMPLHRHRLLKRGSNQCMELAREISSLLDIKIDASSLTRPHAGKDQRGLGRNQRLRNMARVFAAQPCLNGMRIILVDDVFTTGATLRHATMCLQEAGATHVHCAVVARAPLHG